MNTSDANYTVAIKTTHNSCLNAILKVLELSLVN